MNIRTVLAAGSTLLLAAGLMTLGVTSASAHTPEVSADCSVVNVTATRYETKPGTEATYWPEHLFTKTIERWDTNGSWSGEGWIKTGESRPSNSVKDAARDETVANPDYSPAVTEVSHVEYLRYTYNPKGDPQTSTPLTDPGKWQVDHKKYDGSEVGVVLHKGNGNGSYFYWTATTVIDIPGAPASGEPTIVIHHDATYWAEWQFTKTTEHWDTNSSWSGEGYVLTSTTRPSGAVKTPGTGDNATPNTVTVTIDGTVVEDSAFGSEFRGSYNLDPSTGHSYVVAITAWNDPTGDRGWTKTFEGTTTACYDTQPPALVVPGEWVDGQFECGDVTVEQSRTVSTTEYVLDGYEWVKGETTTSTETQTRDLSADEMVPCTTVITTAPEGPTFTDACGTENDTTTLPVNTEEYNYSKTVDGATVTVTATPASEHAVFAEGVVSTWTHAFTDAECPTTVVVVPPTPQKPAAPATQAPESLAATGTPETSGFLGLGALGLLLMGGGALVVNSRRKVTE